MESLLVSCVESGDGVTLRSIPTSCTQNNPISNMARKSIGETEKRKIWHDVVVG